MAAEAFRLASRIYQANKGAFEFFNAALKMVDEHRVAGDIRSQVIRESILRATAWLGSLTRLHHPADVQAIHVGARALFEITIDMVLLHNDQSDSSARKSLAWEESAKLASAERYEAYLVRTGKPHDDEFDGMRLLATDKAKVGAIQASRQKHWGGAPKPGKSTPKPAGHPSRWTGQDLAKDSKAADSVRCLDCFRGLEFQSFDLFYNTTIAQLNWLTHGSGHAALRGLDGTDSTNAVTLYRIFRLVEVLVRIACHEYSFLLLSDDLERLHELIYVPVADSELST